MTSSPNLFINPDLFFSLPEGRVQESSAQGSDDADGLSQGPLPSDALRDGRLHAGDRHAG